MCSTPEPIMQSCTPVAISAAAKLTACWPEPHCVSTVVAEVSIGRSSCSHAVRAMFRPCSPNCCTQPAITFSTSAASTPERASTSSVGAAEQVGRVHVAVDALLGVSRPIGVRTASTMTTSRPCALIRP